MCMYLYIHTNIYFITCYEIFYKTFTFSKQQDYLPLMMAVNQREPLARQGLYFLTRTRDVLIVLQKNM